MDQKQPHWNPAMETLSRQPRRQLREARVLVQMPHVYQGSARFREVWDEGGGHSSPMRSEASRALGLAHQNSPLHEAM